MAMDDISPTPWVVGVTFDGYGWPTYRLLNMRDNQDDSEIEANRKLFEAAPKMVEALLAASEVLPEPGFPTIAAMIDDVLKEVGAE